MFAGRQLEDESRLESCGVSDDSQMYILMRLLGGAKKRKKKTYTKPKKQKHKCVCTLPPYVWGLVFVLPLAFSYAFCA